MIRKLLQEDQTLSLREGVIIDVAIPGDDRVKDKELEKLEKYRLLKNEIAKVWGPRKVIVVPALHFQFSI